MAYVWLWTDKKVTCPTCDGTKEVGTGRMDKWGEEIKQSCGRCSGSGEVTERMQERTWVEDPPEDKK